MSRSKMAARKPKAAKPAKPEKTPSPAPGNFVVLLVDRVNLGQPHRLLRMIPKDSVRRKLKTTGLGRYAQRYQTEKSAADDVTLRRNLIPAKYRAVVTDIQGIDFEAFSPLKMKRIKAKERNEQRQATQS